LRNNNILSPNQFGFQEGVSIVHHLLKLTNFVTERLNEKKYTVGIFLDLRKAFNVVPHDVLLLKLKRMGIKDAALNWFTSYLSNRQQRVEINGKLSNVKNINISILQGSILGPILFLCFINDLPNCTELLTLLFADDTACLISGSDIRDVIKKANTELQKIANWFRANRMAVNVSKTKFIIFKPKGAKLNLNDNEGVVYNDNEIGAVPDESKITNLTRVYSNHPDPAHRTYKLLGVLLDENLSFDQHCQYVHSKISQSNYIINRAKNFLPTSALKTLYFSPFIPICCTACLSMVAPPKRI
jgi:Reverse transcriptase (RNA-dependent DNA polymerase)